ncbi:DUF2127 domain-containing protein [Chroococcidiopsis sp.]|uniref:DUF2127 domain-containing protein n=1 Tax=Chroococcidiopsis sp. TaxID=3088168 RepID=UPI003F2EED0B
MARIRNQKKPLALIAIIIYKSLTASILAIASIAIFLALDKYQSLLMFADDYILTGKREIVKFLLEKLLALNPKTLEFSGVVTGIYAIVTVIEAVGLWYEKAWATILVLILVGISLPVEIFELIRGVSAIKLIVFAINVALFWYLLREFLHRKHDRYL